MNEPPTIAYIAIRSNIHPVENVYLTLKLLNSCVQLKAISTFYWSPPWDDKSQDDHLIGACQVHTNLSAEELKNILANIEHKLHGTADKDKHVSTTINLTLLIFGNSVISKPDLIIPDPDIYKCAFISLPLSDLNPKLILPDTKIPLSAIIIKMTKNNLIADVEFSKGLRRFTI